MVQFIKEKKNELVFQSAAWKTLLKSNNNNVIK